VNIQAIVQAGDSFFLGLTKKKLIDAMVSLRDEYTNAQAQINKLKEENVKLTEELKQHKIKGVNSAANKPSSK
jgi:predicted nuclease with TOPRIM domain